MKAKLVNESANEYSADQIYKKSLSDSYWESLGEKYPGYNREEGQIDRAIKFILNKIKAKYNVKDPDILSQLENKIQGGIT